MCLNSLGPGRNVRIREKPGTRSRCKCLKKASERPIIQAEVPEKA